MSIVRISILLKWAIGSLRMVHHSKYSKICMFLMTKKGWINNNTRRLSDSDIIHSKYTDSVSIFYIMFLNAWNSQVWVDQRMNQTFSAYFNVKNQWFVCICFYF